MRNKGVNTNGYKGAAGQTVLLINPDTQILRQITQ